VPPAKAMTLKIEEFKENDILILDLTGGITLGEDNRVLHDALRRCVDEGERKIILNLEHVTNIDSSGLGELVAGYATLQKNGGLLKLLNLSGRASELMTLTKLFTVFDIFDDETAAIKSFNASGPIRT
jgi:anti-sigma B factor antagonist